MANTKHSVAREIIIDRLLHERRGYSVHEILEIVNRHLETDGFRPVSINTIRNDIEIIRFRYRIPLEVKKRSHRMIYRYEDPDQTIFKTVLTLGELQHLQSAIQSIIFRDPIQASLMYKQISERLGNLLKLDTLGEPILIYEEIPELAELKMFQSMYNCIQAKTPAAIKYRPGKGKKEREIIVHPYYMRQKNQKWILLCYNSTDEKHEEIPITAISNVATAEGVEFIPNGYFDFKDYYKKLKSAA
jgi:hypothetical protein